MNATQPTARTPKPQALNVEINPPPCTAETAEEVLLLAAFTASATSVSSSTLTHPVIAVNSLGHVTRLYSTLYSTVSRESFFLVRKNLHRSLRILEPLKPPPAPRLQERGKIRTLIQRLKPNLQLPKSLVGNLILGRARSSITCIPAWNLYPKSH